MSISRIDHFVLTVSDVDTSCRFYEKVLGMEIVTFGENRKAARFGNQKINFHRAGGFSSNVAGMPTVGSADFCLISKMPIDQWISRFKQDKVTVEEGPILRTGATGPIQSIYIRDPDGNLVEVANQVAISPKIRPIRANDEFEIELVASRMRDTLIEVLGENRGGSMYTMDWLKQRVRFHLDRSQSIAQVFVSEEPDGTISGHTIVRLDRDDDGREIGLFSTIFVVPKLRKLGIASSLLFHGEAWIREQRLTAAATYTSDSNAKLIGLFIQHGFKITSAYQDKQMIRLSKSLAPLPPFDLARTFAALMDQNKYTEAGRLMAPSCVYRYQGKIIEGVDKIIQTYISNYESAQKQLDEIQFFSEVVPGENTGVFKLKYLDCIRKGTSWIEHRCEQTIKVDGEKVVEIEHFDIPGEPEKLKEWFAQVGVKR